MFQSYHDCHTVYQSSMAWSVNKDMYVGVGVCVMDPSNLLSPACGLSL